MELKYFIDINITDMKEVKKKYRELAKMYHPDIPGNLERHPDCIEILKAINNEMDLIETGKITVSSTMYTNGSTVTENPYKAQRITRVIYVIWDKRRNTYAAPCYNGVIDFSDWKHGCGLFFVTIVDDFPYHFCETIEKVWDDVTFDIPEFNEITDMWINQMRELFDFQRPGTETLNDTVYHYIQTSRGEFLYTIAPSHSFQAYGTSANKDIELLTKVCMPDGSYRLEILNIQRSNLGKVQYEETVSLADIMFSTLWGYNYEEFLEQYDTERPSIIDRFRLPINRVTDYTLPHDVDLLLDHWIKAGVVEIYECSHDRRLRYGVLNMKSLIMRKASIEDINMAQDYLDQLNQKFEETFKRMVKKGTIRTILQ